MALLDRIAKVTHEVLDMGSCWPDKPEIYRNNPFYRLITGTPAFNVNSLTRHAIGTANCFLVERHYGLDYALRDNLTKPFAKKP